MKIQIDGTNTVNKGAELMLYAVLEQIEKSHIHAEVIFNTSSASKSARYINTDLNFHKRWIMEHCGKVIYKLKIEEIFNRLHLPDTWLTRKYVCSGIDVVLDAGGFQFSDQWKHNKRNCNEWNAYYSKLKKNGTQIILLPQAFGPFYTAGGQEIAKILDKYVDLIFARDAISQQYLLEAGVSPHKIKLYPDFTSLVEGEFPVQYAQFKGKVCIIPNVKMIEKAAIDSIVYLSFLENLTKYILAHDKDVFLLNHESEGDWQLCQLINERMGRSFPIVSGLTAKETKGVIANSYMAVSSRFHGVASALNSSVPCLATGWSHKYEMLFNDFGEKDRLIDVKESFANIARKIDFVLSEEGNHVCREQLTLNKKSVQERNKQMWKQIWEFIANSKLL